MKKRGGKTMRKISLLIVMCILATCLTGIGVSAASFSGEGSGTDEDPYIITSAEQFNEIATFANAVFKLNAPDGITLTNPTPIKNFSGKLIGVDGANEITVNIDRTGTTTNATLFVNVNDGAVLNNLVIKGSVKGGNAIYTSALVGWINRDAQVSITNILNYADITINYSADDVKSGGIIGMIYNNNSTTSGIITVENCNNYGNIIYSSSNLNTADFGGIVGRIGVGTDTVTIKNCKNYGQINGGGGRFGGIVGISGGPNVTINNCENNGILSGNNDIGGIVGYAQNTLTISDCANNAAITSNFIVTDEEITKFVYCGGIASQIKTNAKIKGCVNNANGIITGNFPENAKPSKSSGFCLGGIAGYINDCATVTESKNYAVVNGIHSSYSAYFFCGGIVGYNIGSYINKCSNHADCDKTTRQFGGIAGRFGTSGEISECYNTGDIRSTHANGYTGGIAARVDDVNCIIENCYNTGTMLSNTYTGGLVGSSKGTVRNSYSIQPEKPIGDVLFGTASTTTSENVYFNVFDDVRNDADAMGLTALQLTDSSAYANLDFNTVWIIKNVDTNTDFPFPQLRNNMHTTDYTDMYKMTVITEENGNQSEEVLYVKGGSTYIVDIQPNEGLMLDELTYNNSPVTCIDTQYCSPEITQNSIIKVKYITASFNMDEAFENGTSYVGIGESITIDDVEYSDFIVSLSRFETYMGYDVTEYGVQLYTEEDYSNDKVTVTVKAADGKKWDDNSFGVLVYGTGLHQGDTYYIKPYVVYKNKLSDEELSPIYGAVQIIKFVKE